MSGSVLRLLSTLFAIQCAIQILAQTAPTAPIRPPPQQGTTTLIDSISPRLELFGLSQEDEVETEMEMDKKTLAAGVCADHDEALTCTMVHDFGYCNFRLPNGMVLRDICPKSCSGDCCDIGDECHCNQKEKLRLLGALPLRTCEAAVEALPCNYPVTSSLTLQDICPCACASKPACTSSPASPTSAPSASRTSAPSASATTSISTSSAPSASPAPSSGAGTHSFSLSGFTCPTGATVTFHYSGALNPSDPVQAQAACEACYGAPCYLETADCAGNGYGPSPLGLYVCGNAYFGYQTGCSGSDGRVWSICGSYTTYGYWGY